MKHARESYNRIQDPENKIPEDEPVFLLRAQDKLAPGIVEAWAENLLDCGGDQVLANMAFKHAQLMREWQREHGCKLPDL